MSAATLFRIVYTSFYFLLYIILVVLLLVSPADIITQSLQGADPQTFFVIVIATAYFTTTFIVVFVYSGRLYINRSVLASIPKAWIPVDKGDVPAAVRKIINASLSRSAAIAYDARPRAPPVHQPGVFDDRQSYRPHTARRSSGLWSPPQQQQEQQQPHEAEGAGQRGSKEGKLKFLKFLNLKKTPTAEDELGINLPPRKPVWGEIEHNGWGSPLSPDFPSLEYATVVSELPHLIEAKALTLAPPDPMSTMPPDSDGASAAPTMFQPDPDAVALLQRGSLPLRDYLSGLAELGVLPTPSQVAGEFLAAYEQARFSTRPLSARAFRELMRLFADLLRSMKPLDPAMLFTDDDNDNDDDDRSSSYSVRGGGRGDVDVDLDDEAPAATATPSTMGGANGRAANGDVTTMKRGGGSRASSPGARSSRTASSAGGYTTSSSSPGRSHIRHHHRHHHRRRQAPAAVGRASPSHAWSQYRTAPNTPRRERTLAEAVAAAVVAARDAEGRGVQVGDETSVVSTLELHAPQPSGSDSSFAQTRHPYAVSGESSGSLISLASSGSVVRFRDG
ncbi:hypothetical protein RB595_005254 [Gaeumannomyces hyphopodioides]